MIYLHNLLVFARGTWWYDFNLLNQFWRNHVYTFVSTKTPDLWSSSLAWKRKINAYHKLPCHTKIVSQHKCKLKTLNFVNLQSSEIKLTFHLYSKQAAQNNHSCKSFHSTDLLSSPPKWLINEVMDDWVQQLCLYALKGVSPWECFSFCF